MKNFHKQSDLVTPVNDSEVEDGDIDEPKLKDTGDNSWAEMNSNEQDYLNWNKVKIP